MRRAAFGAWNGVPIDIEWVEADDSGRSVLAFLRKAPGADPVHLVELRAADGRLHVGDLQVVAQVRVDVLVVVALRQRRDASLSVRVLALAGLLEFALQVFRLLPQFGHLLGGEVTERLQLFLQLDVRVPELDRQIAKPIRPSWIQIRFQALERPECLEEDFDAFSGSTQLVVVASPVFVEP